MSPRKLTEDDKQEILEQYRSSEATTSTLAKSFEVSSSTISRFLKNKLSTLEYEDLIQQKRLARTPRGEKSSTKKQSNKKAKKASAKIEDSSKAKKPAQIKSKPSEPVEQVTSSDDAIPDLTTAKNLLQDTPEETKTKSKRRRRRSQPSAAAVTTPEATEPQQTALELDSNEEVKPNKLVLDQLDNKSEADIPKSERPILKRDQPIQDDDDEDDEDNEMELLALKEMLGEDLEDINDEDDDEDDWEEDDETSYTNHPSSFSDLQILPLSQASLPKTCYIVIDRSAELIVKPLAEFADLGIIPEAEVSQTTLPIFDNHRIAKRFSHRRERVIKVPDSRMLQKTSHHLQEKGITRLLIDGQIYSLTY